MKPTEIEIGSSDEEENVLFKPAIRPISNLKIITISSSDDEIGIYLYSIYLHFVYTYVYIDIL